MPDCKEADDLVPVGRYTWSAKTNHHEEFDHQPLTLDPDIDADLVVRQRDDDTTCALGAAAEIQVLERQGVAIAVLGEHRYRGLQRHGGA